MYELRIQDERINAYRVVKGQTREDVQARAAAQFAIWDEKARRKAAKLETDLRHAQAALGDWEGTRQAESLTEEAQARIESFEGLLITLLSLPTATWNDLKDESKFIEPAPISNKSILDPGKPTREEYEPTLSLLDKILSKRRRQKDAEANANFDKAMKHWEDAKKDIERKNSCAEALFIKEKEAWKAKLDDFRATQGRSNRKIDIYSEQYSAGDADAVEFKITEVLLRTSLPDGFPQGFEIGFNKDSQTLIIDFELPDRDVLPDYKEAKYVRSKSHIVFKPVTESWKRTAYDSILYQTALGITHRVFSADKKN